MPYDLLATGTPLGVLAVLLGILIKMQWDREKKQAEEHQQFVKSVMDENSKREEKLMSQLDKYNESLKEISINIKTIPKMQEDINELKAKIC